jgi:hypothetical protein
VQGNCHGGRRMSDVFISYSREDLASAESVAVTLEERGLSVFWDRSIEIGAAFERIIEKELSSAHVVVVLWSRDSVESEWVRAEAAEAVDRGVLVPAALDASSLPLRYRNMQTADLSNWRPGQVDNEHDRFIKTIVSKARSEVMGATSVVERQPGAPKLRVLIYTALLWAWVGSIGLATTVAYDYGLVRNFAKLHSTAYLAVYLSLIGGGLSTGLVGVISLKRRFIRGVLQGWVWPLTLAFGQLLLLGGISRLLSGLPIVGELDALTAFVICGALGPSLLTLSAIGTLRQLGQR